MKQAPHTVRGRWNGRPIVVLGTVIALMYLAREVLIPLAFALVLSLIWTPPVTWLRRLCFGRVPSVLTVVFVSVLAGGAIGYVIFNQLLDVVSGLPAYQQNIHSKIAILSSKGKGSLGRAADSVERLGQELSVDQSTDASRSAGGRARQTAGRKPAGPVPVEVVEKPANTLGYLRDVVRPFVRPIGIGSLVLVFSIFLLIERQDVRNRFLRLVGLGQLNLMTKALEDAAGRVSRYLLLQFAVNAGFGLTIGVGLYLIGLPYPALWGAVAACLRLIPYLGTLVSVVLPLLVALGVFNSWLPLLWVALLFIVVELSIGNWVEPRLYGAYTGVSALAILVTTVFWTILWGPAGLVLATPLTVCVAVLGRHIPELSFLHILLGDEPVLATETQIYQRLLAMDRAEAREVADLFLKEGTLLELYDRVLLPALMMAEHDRHKGALDSTREAFLFLSVNEMISEFAGYRPPPAPFSTEKNALQDVGAEITKPEFPGRVLCLPASDEADEIAATMLAQLLSARGVRTATFPLATIRRQAFGIIRPGSNDVICISAIPPFAFTQARALTLQIGLEFPRAKVIVGIWGFGGDVEKALDRFEEPRPAHILTTLTDALQYFKVIPFSDSSQELATAAVQAREQDMCEVGQSHA
jgi:predicted PurR-regulated permease PerM